MRTGKIYRTTLDNGIEWIANQDPDAHVTKVALAAKYGHEIEEQGSIGFHHLFEHLTFRQTTLRGTIRASRQQDSAGIWTNGLTINHMILVHAEGKEGVRGHSVAKSLLHRVRRVPDEEQVRTEVNALCEEEPPRVLDPEIDIERRALSLIYPSLRQAIDPHTYLHEIALLDPATAQQRYPRVFCPSAATLVTISNKSPTQLRDVVREFERLPQQPPPTIPRITLPPRKACVQEEVYPFASVCYVNTLLRMFPSDDVGERVRDLAIAEVAGRLIGKADSSAMYEEMRLSRGTTYSPTCDLILHRPELRLQIDYHCRETNLKINRRIETEILESVADGGRFQSSIGPSRLLSRERVATAREGALLELKAQLEDNLDDRLEFFCGNAAMGYFVTPTQLAKHIASVTPGDIRNLMREILPGATTAIYHPPEHSLGATPYVRNGLERKR